MKRIPTVMSALLMVAGGAGALATSALAGAEQNKTDILYSEVNAYNTTTQIEQIDPLKNRIVMRLFGDGQAIRRVVVAQQNYEAGYRRNEAEDKRHSLGEEDNAALELLTDYRVEEANYYTGGLTLDVPGLQENKSDRLYFAIERGDVHKDEGGEEVWENVWWERGTLDYRSCVHSSVYKLNTVICNANYKLNENTYEYIPVNNQDGEVLTRPTNERVLSWEDEWRGIQQERIREVQQDLNALQNSVTNFVQILDGAEKSLDGLDVTLPMLEYNENMLYQVSQLRELLANLRSLIKNDDLTTEERAELTEKIAQLQDANRKLQNENEKLQKELSTIRGEKEALTERIGEKDAEKEVLETRIKQLEQENAQLNNKTCAETVDKTEVVGSIVGATSEDRRSEATMEGGAASESGTAGVINGAGHDEQSPDKIQEEQTETGEVEATSNGHNDSEIEVPKLGGENKTRLVWWWVIPGVMILAMLGIVILKREKRR